MRSKTGREAPIPLVALPAACVLLFTVLPAQAQLEDAGGRLRTSITGVLFHTDNFFYQPDQSQDAWGTLLRPELAYRGATGKSDLDVRLNGEYGMFDTPSSKDDYFDAAGTLAFSLAPTLRNRFGADLGLRRGHDPYGVDRTEGTATAEVDLDEWNQFNGGLRYRYGAPGARVNAELALSGFDKEYTTNRAFTEFLDYYSTTADYSLFYNYSPKSSAVLSFSRSDIQFDRSFDNNAGPGGSDLDHRSGEIYQVRAGLTWLATGKTSGDVRGGYRQRTFDNLDETQEGFDWQVGLKWAPSPPMLVEVTGGRDEQQSYRLDTNVIDTQALALAVRRSMSARARVSGSVELLEADFVGGDRKDETLTFRTGLEYLLQRNLFAVGNVDYASRSSNAALRDYDRLSAFVGVRLGR